MNFERIFPPDFADSHAPRCPECDSKMFYVGIRHELNKGDCTQHKLYQCGECRRLWKELEVARVLKQ